MPSRLVPMSGKSTESTVPSGTRSAKPIASARSFQRIRIKRLESILNRLKACRDRFITEGSGPARRQCLCSVFKDIIEGNGGRLPRIDDWERIYRELNCPLK